MGQVICLSPSRCVYVRNGEIIGEGSNRTNEERNVSLFNAPRLAL